MFLTRPIKRGLKTAFALIVIALFSACSKTDLGSQSQGAITEVATEYVQSPSPSQTSTHPTAAHPPRAYFGELHVHTMNSPDAFLFNVRSTPDQAMRFAKGESVEHSVSGARMQLSRPLDFISITDHSEYMGILPKLFQADSELGDSETSIALRQGTDEARQHALMDVLMTLGSGKPKEQLVDPTLRTSIWQRYVELANRHYEPGKFTTLIGYEWTSSGGRPEINLHRNVIFRSDKVSEQPFSSFDSVDPKQLWSWMDHERSKGIELMAIPHNSNLSDGLMFPDQQAFDESTIDQLYADQRNRNEPLIEITQIKGSSETHPALSPNDEWANFEILEDLLGGNGRVGALQGSYARDAWLTGILMESTHGFNPYEFGVIAASDSHNSSTQVEENNYHGKIGSVDGTPETRRGGSLINTQNVKYSASGLAGVWAEGNTREAIFDALTRGETFGTSGPRIQLRMFGGWEWQSTFTDQVDWVEQAQKTGVPMGQRLPLKPDNASGPTFAVSALKDPSSAWLQRLQIVKGWIEDGERREAVYDIACSDGLVPDQETNRCPDNGASVSIETCDFDHSKGDVQLNAVWQDPDFSAEEHAFYYARVLENPTCRWSTWDTIRTGLPLDSNVPATIQERAYGSPIWHKPE